MTSIVGSGYKTKVPGGVTSTPGRPILSWRFDVPRVPAKPRASKNDKQVDLGLDAEIVWVIYVLCDPRVDDPLLRIRYVGVTARTAHKRLVAHLGETRRGGCTHKCNWLRELLALGLRPTIEAIDPGTVERRWDKTEIAWVKHFREMGCPLTNATDGGRGSLNPSPEIRKKHSDANYKRFADPMERAKIADANRGRVASTETRAKISNNNRNRGAEWREKLAEAKRKRVVTDETRAKISAINSQRIVTDETRAKLSLSSKKQMSDPAVKEKLAIANRNRVVTEETRTRLSASNKATWSDPVLLKKHSELLKAAKRRDR